MSSRAAAAGQVRIIGGELRNSRLTVPELPGLRPTPVRVRETLFNWLMPVLHDAKVLDLFAGTGVLGMEALSRGAASAVFVEQHIEAVQALRHNLIRLKQGAAQVHHSDAQAYLQGPGQSHDVIFIDPPFALDLWQPVTQQLEQGGWLSASAWIYLELPRPLVPCLPANWQLHREGAAGKVRYALYRRMTYLR